MMKLRKGLVAALAVAALLSGAALGAAPVASELVERPAAEAAPFIYYGDESEGGESLSVGESVRHSLVVGEALTVNYLGGALLSVRSGNTAVASVRSADLAAGRVTFQALKAGRATLRARLANGDTVSISLEVVDPYTPTGIYLSATSYEVELDGAELVLSPTLTPATAITGLTWSSSDTSVAGVRDGRILPRATGTATITVRTDNGRRASATVKVISGRTPTGVFFPESYVEMAIDDGMTLLPVLEPNTAETTFTWSSSNTGVATVKNGVVTAVGAGTATITVTTANGKTASVSIEVADPSAPSGVSLPSAMEIGVGESLRLTPEVTPASASTTFTWSSSDSGRVSVSQSGNVTGVSSGSATITVRTANGKTATCLVTVSNEVKYRALLVGNNRFYNLNTPGWEGYSYNYLAAAKLESTLKGVYTPSGSRYSVTVKNDLSLAQLESAISSTFAGADDNDVSLFYFASHGLVGTGTLVMASTSEQTPEKMTLQRLCDDLVKVRGRVIVLLDCCGSGAGVVPKGAGGSVDIEDQLADFDARVIEAFAQADPGVYVSVPAAAEDGEGVVPKLGELRVANKFYVLCSSSSSEESFASATGSYFTTWMTEGMGVSGNMPADQLYAGNGDGQVDLYELYKYVSAVGDTRKFITGGVTHYQHVQVYPADTRYPLCG